MDNAKRASMREGPLAQLFRKTDEEEGAPQEEPKREERKPEPRPEPPRQQRRPEPPAAPTASTPAGSRYEGTPTPEERLRTVFSSDIPENIMEREVAPVVPDPDPAVPAWAAPASTPSTA